MTENTEKHLEMAMTHIFTQRARIKVVHLSLFPEKHCTNLKIQEKKII